MLRDGTARPEGNGSTGDPTRRIRRQNYCKICGRLTQDTRAFCWYCVRYVH